MWGEDKSNELGIVPFEYLYIQRSEIASKGASIESRTLPEWNLRSESSDPVAVIRADVCIANNKLSTESDADSQHSSINLKDSILVGVFLAKFGIQMTIVNSAQR